MNKRMKKFEDVSDPFNPENKVSGWFKRNSYHKLHITKVNGEKVPQEIAVTPKLGYPFDRDFNYHFPPKIYGVDVYEKLDGTNICQFIYKDAENKSYISYRTRGMLFMSEEFEMLLRKVLKKYPEIKKLPFKNGCNLSYELYGYLNPITILYDTDIDIRCLFGIKDNHQTIPLAFLKIPDKLKCPLLKSFMNPGKQDISEELKDIYNKIRYKLEDKLGTLKTGYLTGKEGAVWYIHCFSDDGSLFSKMYKLKPPTIEKMCWEGNNGLSNHAIITTAKNAAEDIFPITFEHVRDLLLEEFNIHEIMSEEGRILSMINKVNAEKILEREIVKVYKQSDIAGDRRDKGYILRWFDKNTDYNTVKVYNTLSKFGVFE